MLFYTIDSGETQDLTELEGIEDVGPAFSPDGAYLAFGRKFLDVRQWSPGRQLWLMRLADGEAFQLINDPLYNHYDFAWSPAGDRLAFVRFNQSLLTEPPEVWTIDLVSAVADTSAPGAASADHHRRLCAAMAPLGHFPFRCPSATICFCLDGGNIPSATERNSSTVRKARGWVWRIRALT